MAGSGTRTIRRTRWTEDDVWQEAFTTRVPSRGRHPITGRERGPRPVPAEAPIPAPHPAAAPVAAAPRASAETHQPQVARRTVTIRGRGAERHLPWPGDVPQRRPSRALHERAGFRPDRLAMWAVLLGLLLVLVAAMSAH